MAYVTPNGRRCIASVTRTNELKYPTKTINVGIKFRKPFARFKKKLPKTSIKMPPNNNPYAIFITSLKISLSFHSTEIYFKTQSKGTPG
jgi:hypothetical protein